jgi:quinol monooxygenase YgiN
MYVTVYTYRARAGQEDAILALHECWVRSQRLRVEGFLSGELMSLTRDPRTFVEITRYESEQTAQAAAADPEQEVWQQRLASLTEGGLLGGEYGCVWRSD